MKPRISIVIPVYNGSDFLEQAIESALAQTYDNFEVIVVNDGSNDAGATQRIALGYGDRIRYFSKPNGGVASVLNYAISEMSGAYFSWLSHDDLYCEDKLERQVAALAAIDAAVRDRTVIYCDYAVFSSDPEKAVPVRLAGVAPESFRYWLTVENSLHGCALLIPRTAFAECGAFDEKLRTTQDFDLWFRMAGRYRFVHIPSVLVKVRSHAGQGSIKMAKTALAECNSLLTQFANGLTLGELSADGRRTPAAAYAQIEASCWRRRFFPAARSAHRLAMRHLKGESLQSAIRIVLVMARARVDYRILGVARALIPPRLRLALRNLASAKAGDGSNGQDSAGGALQQKFSEIYDKNIFGGRLSRSGEGSDLAQTAVIRRELPLLMKKLDARTFLDAPCGDWFWMRRTDLCVEKYTGVDIVEALIERNTSQFGNDRTTFRCVNLMQDDLPEVDVILSRDCLVHLSFEDARRIIGNFKRSGSKYLLTTTFVDRSKNNDLVGKDSFWRPLNLQLPPFNLPPPLMLINEGCTEERGQYKDKCLGLWSLQDIENQ